MGVGSFVGALLGGAFFLFGAGFCLFSGVVVFWFCVVGSVGVWYRRFRLVFFGRWFRFIVSRMAFWWWGGKKGRKK